TLSGIRMASLWSDRTPQPGNGRYYVPGGGSRGGKGDPRKPVGPIHRVQAEHRQDFHGPPELRRSDVLPPSVDQVLSQEHGAVLLNGRRGAVQPLEGRFGGLPPEVGEQTPGLLL